MQEKYQNRFHCRTKTKLNFSINLTVILVRAVWHEMCWWQLKDVGDDFTLIGITGNELNRNGKLIHQKIWVSFQFFKRSGRELDRITVKLIQFICYIWHMILYMVSVKKNRMDEFRTRKMKTSEKFLDEFSMIWQLGLSYFDDQYPFSH